MYCYKRSWLTVAERSIEIKSLNISNYLRINCDTSISILILFSVCHVIMNAWFQLAPSFRLSDDDNVTDCACDESIFTPKAQMTIQLKSFSDFLHFDFLVDNLLNENVSLKVTYDLNPLKHFPDYPNGTLPATLSSVRQLHVGKRGSSFKCSADERVELDFFPYHMELTINTVHLQVYDINGGQFSPGKKIKTVSMHEFNISLKSFAISAL